VKQQSKKRNRGNRDFYAGLPRYDACIALVSIGIRQDKQRFQQCENVLSIRAVAMLEIDRKKKAPEPLPIGVNNRLKPLMNLV
jgi:hypothetical protein